MDRETIWSNVVGTGLDPTPLKNKVESVNGKTGAVNLTAKDVGALSQDALGEGVNQALQQAKESGAFDGKDGVDGKDYTLTEKDKEEIADLIPIPEMPGGDSAAYTDVTEDYNTALEEGAVTCAREYLWALGEGRWSLVDGDEKYYLQTFLGDFSAEPIYQPKRILIRCWEFLDIEIHSDIGRFDAEPYLRLEGETGTIFRHGGICNPTDLSLFDGRAYLSHGGIRFGKGVELPSSGGGIEVSGAKVGDSLKVKEVDENGVPTAWETAEIPVGGSNAFRLIRDITIPEDITTDTSGVNFVYADDEQTSVLFGFDTDANGKPFELTELIIVTTNAGTIATADNVARVAFDSAIPNNISTNGIAVYGVTKNSGAGHGINQITLLGDGNAFTVKTNFGGGTNNAVQSSAKPDNAKVDKIDKVRLGTQNANKMGFTEGSQFRFYGR